MTGRGGSARRAGGDTGGGPRTGARTEPRTGARIPAGAWVAAAFVGLIVAVFAVGSAYPLPAPPITTDAVGPENSETAQEYIARAAADLDAARGAPGDRRWALVSFDDGIDGAAAADAVSPARISEVLTSVPLGGRWIPMAPVQTPASDDPAAMTDRAQQRAAERIDARAPSGTGGTGDRGGSGEAGRIAADLRAGCACITGLVVHADLSRLRDIAHRPGVAAVDALPPDAVFGSFAVRPLAPLLG